MSLQHSLLVLLAEQPSSGYELSQKFKSGVGYFWKASHQQIYTQLKKLTEDGLIDFEEEQQEGKPDKKIYKVTAQGMAGLKTWLSSEIKPSKTNDALLVMIYGGRYVGDDVILKEVRRHRDIHQKGLEKLLAIESLYFNLDDELKPQYRLPYLTLKRGIRGEQSWLEWADEVIAELSPQ
ncbi:PadR family transcriptional regulator [Litoribacillus peritrichatus]|uniref:PadR family transcriptional regulator n=1 Tax=Litoribacillus peritrichatus TaxID=718191 RepID=A0ABP7MMP9_9GAMM